MSKRKFDDSFVVVAEPRPRRPNGRKLVKTTTTVTQSPSALQKLQIDSNRFDAYSKRQLALSSRQNSILMNPRTGGFLGIEKKFMDTFLATTQIAGPSDCTGGELDPATMNCLNGVAQGDGESQRDGKNYMIKSLHFLGRVVTNSQTNKTAGWIPASVFIAIVLDTQTNGAQLNSEDVYTNPAASIANNSSLQRNLQYSSRFRVLKTFKLDFNQRTLSWDGTNMESNGQSQSIECHLDNLNIKVQTNGTAATCAVITDNSLHVVGFCTNITETVNLTYTSRIRFVG